MTGQRVFSINLPVPRSFFNLCKLHAMIVKINNGNIYLINLWRPGHGSVIGRGGNYSKYIDKKKKRNYIFNLTNYFFVFEQRVFYIMCGQVSKCQISVFRSTI